MYLETFNLRAIAERLHDGSSAHFSHVVGGVLSNTYHDQVLGRGGPTTWPPHSTDSNHLDFYVLGHLKTVAYAACADNEENLAFTGTRTPTSPPCSP